MEIRKNSLNIGHLLFSFKKEIREREKIKNKKERKTNKLKTKQIIINYVIQDIHIIFSAFEIWFKQMLFDMDSIIEIFDERPVSV